MDSSRRAGAWMGCAGWGTAGVHPALPRHLHPIHNHSTTRAARSTRACAQGTEAAHAESERGGENKLRGGAGRSLWAHQ